MPELFEVVQPSDEDYRLAMETRQRLEPFLLAHPEAHNERFQVQLSHYGDTLPLVLPGSALFLLCDILTQMAQGNSVTLSPNHDTLTIPQAADFLNVSTPYVESLISGDQIPLRVVGTHRQILLADLVAYKKRSDAKRRAALEELSALGQEIDEGF